MRQRLGLAWVMALIVVPLVLIAGLTANHAGLLGTPPAAAAPRTVDKTPALQWSDIDVVNDRHVGANLNSYQKLQALPVGDPQNPWAYFLGWKDLTKLDLTQKGDELMQWATFDSTTRWPSQMPSNFSPNQVMELGKDPGLGLRQVHQQGVTGKGVHVAILDLSLFRDHQEYADRVVKYTEIGDVAEFAEIHGAAVTSLLAGKTIGVAPEAMVTYYAVQIIKNGGSQRTFLYLAATINKILDDNKALPPDQRIRVISMSIGVDPNEEGYTAVNDAYKRAMREGVLVVSTDMDNRYKYAVNGLTRDPLKDPNDPSSYGPGRFWADYFFQNQGRLNTAAKLIYAPMDSRTTAAETAAGDYRFYREGGLSWSVPWMAGMYALVCQVHPQVTPEEFLKVAYDTGDTIKVSGNGKTYDLGPIMNPAKIIAHFQK